MKKIIRLTESDLHHIVRQSVNEALNELDPRTYASYANKRQAQGQMDKAEQGKQAARNAFNKQYGSERQGNFGTDYFNQMRGNNYTVTNGKTEYDPHNEEYREYFNHLHKNLGHPSLSKNQTMPQSYVNANTPLQVAQQMAHGNGQYVKGKGWQ